MVRVFTHGELFWKGAKPTQLTLTFKGASTWEGCGVLDVLLVPLPTPRTSMLLRFRLRSITGGSLSSWDSVVWRSVWPMTFLGASGLLGQTVWGTSTTTTT